MGSNPFTVICITSAHRKQGKTQLVMRIIEGLTKEGYKVGSIKHIGAQSSFNGAHVKDTTRHAEAGAKLVVAVTQSEIITHTIDDNPSLPKAIEKFSGDFDFIIVEGFKKSSYPRFIIIDNAGEIQGLEDRGPVLGITGYITQNDTELKKLETPFPIVEEKDIDKLLAIIKNLRYEQLLTSLPGKNCGECGLKDCQEMAKNLLEKKVSFNKCPHMTAELSLEIDDTPIVVKDFVQNIIRGSIEGMLQTLKGVSREPKKIIIRIEHV
ncbi:MAG: molybdopterin-guanine dinucleotide biosynthesis protein B [Promethearchaeota archaeon]|nr:MAG: molybdopterin-guanine dinucleotide biosynthesis protein B [Candidatus Lokiarchaeota archaeon]